MQVGKKPYLQEESVHEFLLMRLSDLCMKCRSIEVNN